MATLHSDTSGAIATVIPYVDLEEAIGIANTHAVDRRGERDAKTDEILFP